MSRDAAAAHELGRQDHREPLMSWRTRANLVIAGFGAVVLGAWHLALVLTADGLGLGELPVTVRALARLEPLTGLAGVTPASTATTLAAFVGVLVAVLVAYVTVGIWWGRRRVRRARRGFADNAGIRAGLGVERARRSAKQTRPGLSESERRRVEVHQVGLQLGTSTTGEPVVLPLEDHVIVLAPTGGGKSRDQMIPAAVSAPGALVVTSTRADLLDVIAKHRARLGRVFVFDPLDRVGWFEPMYWDAVAGCRDGDRAIARGLAFAAGLGADNKDSTNAGFFQKNASSALTRLLHAADLEGLSMQDVVEWAIQLDNGAEVPQDIIRTSTDPLAEPLWAGMLRSVATGADETVASSRQTLQQAVEPLALRRVMRWVTPREGARRFDPAEFVTSSDTLVLVADATASTNVAPLCAMLLQEVVDAAKAAAARRPGQRIDPPLRLVGDEIANVAPLPKLPDLSSDSRGFGLQMVLAVQSLGQMHRRWGTQGTGALLDNMAAEILFGGIKDQATLTRYSALVGDVELTRSTTSYDATTGRATTSSEQLADRKVLRADEARRIPDGHGLLIYRNQPAVLLRMTPWYQQAGGTQLESERAATERRRVDPTAPTQP